MNILSNLQQISNIIIRPSRYTYKLTDLGNRTFKINQKAVFRQDFEIKNPRGMKIKASIYSTKQLKDIEQVMIYLHCNSGCRIEGLAYLKLAIQHDLAYVVFDFTGSGMSEGKYVSLGFYQTVDLECVFTHLKAIVSDKAKFLLWGRSMGAVTALNFLLKNQHEVFMAILDSPFRSLKQLFIQIGRQKTSFPDFILQMAYNYLKPIILQKAQLDIQQVGLKLQNNTITTPGIFVASKQDSLVPFQQIDQIFSLYKGEKEMLFIEQGHNEARNSKVIGDIFKSIKKQLLASEINAKLKIEKQMQKKNYFSSLVGEKLDRKQLSRKKLQLTIKSLSHRQLLATANVGKMLGEGEMLVERKRKITQQTTRLKNALENDSKPQQFKLQKQILQTPIPHLQKKPISCLLPHKQSLKVLSIDEEQNRFSFQDSDKKLLISNKSQSKLKVKKKPFQIKNFFGNQNNIANKEKDFIKIEESDKKKDVRAAGIPKTEPLREKCASNNMIKHQQRTRDPLKNLSAIYSSKQAFNTHSPQKLSQGQQMSQRRPKLQLGQLSTKKPKQKQQPHSDIKNQNQKINNFHEDFIKQKQFLKRCQSLQKVFRVNNNNNDTSQHSSQQHLRQLQLPTTTHTYRQIKCTQRVLEKIIEKQERKLLILNLQSMENNSRRQQYKQPMEQMKERKTLQHVINKKPPFVELKGVKNFRNSLETKYKTEIRK